MVAAPGNEGPPLRNGGEPGPERDDPGRTNGPGKEGGPGKKGEPGARKNEPGARKGEPGRRRRRRRESALAWWALFAAWAVAAWWLWSWRLALLGLLAWCLYQFVLVPTICRVTTRQGFSCREPVRGRLFACRVEHQRVKSDALWRLAFLKNPLRKKAVPDANRETGQVVVSPAVRGRLAQADRILILLAAAGTLVTVAGTVFGYT